MNRLEILPVNLTFELSKSTSLRHLTVCFLTQIFVLLLPAQEHYNFIHYPAESGIVSFQVNTAVQDQQGYMWFGTTSGLQRFDGIRFKTFRHDDKNPGSLPSNPVWQTLVDKKKNLWLMLSDGRVGIFDTRNFIFKEIPTKFKGPVSPNTSLKRLITDDEGNLFYLISGSEVITFNEKASRFSYEFNFFKQKPEWRISDFIQQPGTRKYWLAIVDGGLAIYNKSNGVLSYAGNNTEREPAIDAFDKTKTYYSLFFDTANRLWSVEQEDYPIINCFSIPGKLFVVQKLSLYPQVKSDFEIKHFVQQKDGTIWVHGLLLMGRFVEGENRFQLVYNGYSNEHSIVYEMVHALYEDRENNVWVCTDNNGLYRFNPSKEFFTNVDHTNRVTGKKGDGNVLSFMSTRSGNLLVGTRNDGIYHYDKDFNLLPFNIGGIEKPGTHSIWSMAVSKDGNTLWMGSDPGFYAVNQQGRTAKYFNPTILVNGTIRQLAEDKNGNLWIGTQTNGVFTCNIGKTGVPSSENTKLISTVPPVQINKITIDSKNQIWVGTPENGLYVVDPDSGSLIIHFGEQENNARKLPERGISSIMQYNDTIMLISTATQLIRYNIRTKQLNQVIGSNVITGFITAMEKDSKGFVWLTSTSGLYEIDLNTNTVITYDRSDGLDNEHFIQSASLLLPDGKILFGGTHNFISFSPEKIKDPQSINDVKVTDIKLENKTLNTDSILSLKEFTLGYDDNSLVISFSPFTYTGISMVEYKMEGLDKDWTSTDKTYQAIYNYLPPGTYSFMIRSPDVTGNASNGILMMKIKVKSPFWKTWWFYSFLALLAAGLLYWLDRERTSRKNALQKMRSDIADDLHQEVNTALGNINILSEVARLKSDTEPEKSREFIEQIHSRSHNMIIAMDDILWSISPENDSMEKTILRLKEFIEALKNRNGVQIDLLIDKKVYPLQLNMKQRKDVFWLLKNGIANVVRTGGQNCLIHITYEKPNLVYTLEFDTSHVNLHVLNNLRQRQELKDKLNEIDARLDVHEMKTKMIFHLTIPVSG